MNWKGFRWKRSGLNGSTFPEFVWRKWWKPRNTSISLDGVPAKIRTEHFLNKNLRRYHQIILTDSSVSWIFISMTILSREGVTIDGVIIIIIISVVAIEALVILCKSIRLSASKHNRNSNLAALWFLTYKWFMPFTVVTNSCSSSHLCTSVSNTVLYKLVTHEITNK
jgi:hypothetical protein